jgi:predicted esterase
MRTLPIVCAASWLTLAAFAADSASQCLPIVVGNAEGNYIVPGVQGDIFYRHANGQAMAMDAYAAARRESPGCRDRARWRLGHRQPDERSPASFSNCSRALGTLVRRRLPAGRVGSVREAVDDLRTAVQFVRCHAREFRIDPGNIALLGEDAGAHLALMLGTEAPAGVRPWSASAASMISPACPASRLDARPKSDGASPVKQTLTRMPPVLVIHGGNDAEVPPGHADAFCAAMRSAGGSCTLTIVDGAIHRPENWWPSQWGYKPN